MVSWFKEQFAHPEVQRARSLEVEPEALFDELIVDVPPGADGLVLQPYWSPGIRTPGPEAKGAIIGFSDRHTRGHVYRALLEGIAFGLREGCGRIERKSGVKVKRVRVSGGGAQSNAAMQLTADIFGMPAERPHTFETSGLGAAINVAVGSGAFDNYHTALESMTRCGEVFQPNPDNVQRYNELYEKVYTPMYRRLKPLYNALRKIGF